MRLAFTGGGGGGGGVGPKKNVEEKTGLILFCRAVSPTA